MVGVTQQLSLPKFDGRFGLPAFDALFAVLTPFQHIGIAVSGGADSLALLFFLSEWNHSAGKQLTVFTVDHGLRPEAAKECANVAQLCAHLSVRCKVLRWEGAKPKAGLQEQARQARYALIASAMKADNVEVLTTAHHLDDQAETVLMRLANSSGLKGLAGIAQLTLFQGMSLCRPLLGVEKNILQKCVAQTPLVPVQDPSNDDEKFERVRWRRALSNLSELHLTAQKLGMFAARSERADEALDYYARRTMNELSSISDFGVVRFPAEPFSALPNEIAVRVLRFAVEWAGAGSRPNVLHPIERLSQILRVETDFSGQTVGGAQIYKDGEHICVTRETARLPRNEIILEPGQTLVWDCRFKVTNLSAGNRLTITSGADLSRKSINALFDQDINGPMREPRCAPVVKDAAGSIRAIGCQIVKHEDKQEPVCVKLDASKWQIDCK